MTGCLKLRQLVGTAVAVDVGLDVVTVDSGTSLLRKDKDTGVKCFRLILRGGEEPLSWAGLLGKEGSPAGGDIFLLLALAIFDRTVSWKGGDGLGLDFGVSCNSCCLFLSSSLCLCSSRSWLVA